MAVPITAGGGGALLKDIEYIYAVYKERSFSKAARRLFISQPSLSAAVKRVEQELGLPLFNRSTSPVSLTEAGEYYIKSAEKIMEIEREMRAHLAELAGGGPASLRVGSSMFFCSYVLPDIVGEFRKEHGSVVVTLSEGSSVALSEKLKDGSLDFMLEAEPPDKNIFESAVWTTEEIILAVPAAFAINGELEEYRCTFEELAASRKGGPRKPAAPPERFAGEEFLILTPRTDDDGILPRIRGQGHRLRARRAARLPAADGQGLFLPHRQPGVRARNLPLLQKIRRPHPNTARFHRIHEKGEAPARKRKDGGRIKPPPRWEILSPLLSP